MHVFAEFSTLTHLIACRLPVAPSPLSPALSMMELSCQPVALKFVGEFAKGQIARPESLLEGFRTPNAGKSNE